MKRHHSIDASRARGSHSRARVITTALVGACWALAHPAAAQDRFTDGILGESTLLDSLVRTSPELQALRSELEAARARAAAAGYAPPAVLSGEIEDVPDGFDIADATIRLEVGREFLTGGRSAAARALAAAEVRMAEAALGAAERRVAATVIQELWRLVAATGTARRLAGVDSLLLAAEASLRDRFAVGHARYIDVLRLRTERLRAQTARADAIAETRVAREMLLGVAGGDQASRVAPMLDAAVRGLLAAPELRLVPAPPLDSLLTFAGPIQMAEAAVERARAAREVVLAERRVRVGASIGVQRMVGESGGSSFGPVLGASITLPFTAARANAAAALAAEREVRAGEAARHAVVSRVRAELAGTLARYDAALERLAVYDAALLRAAREARESAIAAYRTGELSLVELLDFERALSRAEIERLDARADAAEAYANLIAAAAGAR